MNCVYCGIKIKKLGKGIHQSACPLNPKNIKYCPVCDGYIKNYHHNKTCSHICANRLFKQRRLPDEKLKDCRIICFRHHEKICCICGEELIVDVHHYDEDHNNNDPKNLVPICSTHHRYWHHNTYKYIVKECIDEYVKNFKALKGKNDKNN